MIPTELLALDLVGSDPTLGGVRVRLNPERSSLGEVRAQGPECVFAADSFFDVFVRIEV